MNEKDATCKETIKACYGQLSPTEKKVADYVLENGHDVSQMTLSELSKRIQVSEPSILRFAKSIGFDGYSGLKTQMIKDWGKESSAAEAAKPLIDLHFNPNDQLKDIPEKMIGITVNALRDTLGTLDIGAFSEAVRAIARAERTDVFGAGNSGSIALDFTTKLLRIGLNARYYADNHLQQLACLSLGKKDVAIAMSHSGSTTDTVNTLRLAKEAGAVTVSITNYKASVIAQYADIKLLTGDHETTFYSETMVSRTSQLAIVDMLYMGILLSDYQKYTTQLDKTNLLVASKNS